MLLMRDAECIATRENGESIMATHQYPLSFSQDTLVHRYLDRYWRFSTLSGSPICPPSSARIQDFCCVAGNVTRRGMTSLGTRSTITTGNKSLRSLWQNTQRQVTLSSWSLPWLSRQLGERWIRSKASNLPLLTQVSMTLSRSEH